MVSFTVDSQETFNRYNNDDELLDTMTELTWRYDVPIEFIPPTLTNFTLDVEGYRHNIPNFYADDLETISVNNTILTSLPNLPQGLISLDCSHNRLRALPELPDTLVNLICHNNRLDELPVLPDGLEQLDCSFNNTLHHILNREQSQLPNSLVSITANDCSLVSFSNRLPSNLRFLDISNNYIDTLPRPRQGLELITEPQREESSESEEEYEAPFESEEVSNFEPPDLGGIGDWDEPDDLIRLREDIPPLNLDEDIVNIPRSSPRFGRIFRPSSQSPSPRQSIEERKRNIEENMMRASAIANTRLESKSQERKIDHHFDLNFCHSTEDILGNRLDEVDKIYIFSIPKEGSNDFTIFCFSEEELLGSLNSTNMQGQNFGYWRNSVFHKIYKLPLFGYVNEGLYDLITVGGYDTFRLYPFPERVRSDLIYDGEQIDRNELLRRLRN